MTPHHASIPPVGVFPAAPATAAAALEPPPAYWFQLADTGRVSSMCQEPDGRIPAPSMEHDVGRVFGEAGQFLAAFGSGGTGPGQFGQPAGVAMDPAGNLCVCDQANHRVQEFSPTCVPLPAMGSFGAGPGQPAHPTHCAVSKDGSRIHVTELTNGRVEMFGTGAGPLHDPWAVFPARNGGVRVGDPCHCRIQVFRDAPVPVLVRSRGSIKNDHR